MRNGRLSRARGRGLLGILSALIVLAIVALLARKALEEANVAREQSALRQARPAESVPAPAPDEQPVSSEAPPASTPAPPAAPVYSGSSGGQPRGLTPIERARETERTVLERAADNARRIDAQTR
jgi:predicted lipid-binding transport protein (Tim44 family)